jgi:hypothetical protein
VVDVRAASRDASIVQDALSRGGELVQPRAELLLAERARVPGSRGLRVISECVDEPAELGVRGADPLFAAGSAAFELSTCGGSGTPESRVGGSSARPGRSSCVTQRTVLVERSYNASALAGSGAPQTRQVPAYRRRIRFSSAVVSPSTAGR